MLRGHMRLLLQTDEYKHVQRKFIAIESNNNALASDDAAQVMVEVDPAKTRVLSQDPKNRGRIGVWTMEETKHVYNALMKQILGDDSLRIAKTFIGKHQSDHIKTLADQMRRWRREEQPVNDDPLFQAKRRVSYGAKDGGEKDDVCLALMIGTKCMFDQRRDESWIQQAQLLGISRY